MAELQTENFAEICRELSMPAKRSRTRYVLAILIVVAVAAVVAIRVKLPGSPSRVDQPDQAGKTATIATTITSIMPATPLPSKIAAGLDATATPISAQLDGAIPCFAFERLPAFAFVPDGSALMLRTDLAVQVFNLKTGSLEASIKSNQMLTATALSPDGQTLAWALQDNTIQLVRVSDQQVLHTLAGHTDTVTKLGFTPGGDILVSASHDHSVIVWSTAGEQLRTIQTDALGIGISHDGSMLATIPFDGPVALWDLATGEKIKDIGGYGGYDTSDAVFSPDGQLLAADLASGLYLWKIADASVIWNGVNSMAVAFSPDGQYLAFSNIDNGNEVILASADTGHYLRSIDAMQSPVWELTFSPDSSLLAITDGTEIHVRTVKDGAMVAVGKSACP